MAKIIQAKTAVQNSQLVDKSLLKALIGFDAYGKQYQVFIDTLAALLGQIPNFFLKDQYIAGTTVIPATKTAGLSYLLGTGTYTEFGNFNTTANPATGTVPADQLWIVTWNGSKWNGIKFPVNLSGYLQKTDIDVAGGVVGVDKYTSEIGNLPVNTTLGSNLATGSSTGHTDGQDFYVLKNTLNNTGADIIFNKLQITHGSITAGAAFNIAAVKVTGSTVDIKNITALRVAVSGVSNTYYINFTLPNGYMYAIQTVAGVALFNSTGAGFYAISTTAVVTNNAAGLISSLLISVSSIAGQLSSQKSRIDQNTTDIAATEAKIGTNVIKGATIGDATFTGNVSRHTDGEDYYAYRDLTYATDFVVDKITLNHSGAAVGTSFKVGQAKINSDGSVVISNLTSLTTTVATGAASYSLGWTLTAGNFIIIQTVARLFYYVAGRGQGFSPINATTNAITGTTANAAFSISISAPDIVDNRTLFEVLATKQTKVNLDAPTNGVVNFTVKINTKFQDNDSNTLATQDGETWEDDFAMLLLPSSYTKDGKPTRLILAAHGTGEPVTATSSTWGASGVDISLFWRAQGYAILDVNGLPASWGTATTDRPYGSPFGLQSFIKAYQYVIQNYNVYKEVFVMGMSMGGLMSNQIVQSGAIPVIAQGVFCPCIEHFKQAFYRGWNGATQKSNIAKVFGFNKGTTPTTWSASGALTQAEFDYYKANYLDRIAGYNPILNGTNVNPSTFYVFPIESDADEAAKYNALSKQHKAPIKIWHNTDDTTVLYKYSQFMVNMIKNAGGIAYLRTFPSGGHNAWLNGADVTVNGVTTKSSVYECYLWFKRFER